VWDAWTKAEQLKHWFTPAPWKTSECEIDLRPGGRFRTVMNGPDGEVVDSEGCYLEIDPGRKLVWTDALAADYRPQSAPFLTGIVLLEDAGEGTKYTAIAKHADPESKTKHEEMGFHQGWGAALDQLVAYVRTL
jgi:uncharacterized protein YndB with AHSA1/START domain